VYLDKGDHGGYPYLLGLVPELALAIVLVLALVLELVLVAKLMQISSPTSASLCSSTHGGCVKRPIRVVRCTFGCLKRPTRILVALLNASSIGFVIFKQL
jgi:preprotein translocase subunit SecG